MKEMALYLLVTSLTFIDNVYKSQPWLQKIGNQLSRIHAYLTAPTISEQEKEDLQNTIRNIHTTILYHSTRENMPFRLLLWKKREYDWIFEEYMKKYNDMLPAASRTLVQIKANVTLKKDPWEYSEYTLEYPEHRKIIQKIELFIENFKKQFKEKEFSSKYWTLKIHPLHHSRKWWDYGIEPGKYLTIAFDIYIKQIKIATLEIDYSKPHRVAYSIIITANIPLRTEALLKEVETYLNNTVKL